MPQHSFLPSLRCYLFSPYLVVAFGVFPKSGFAHWVHPSNREIYNSIRPLSAKVSLSSLTLFLFLSSCLHNYPLNIFKSKDNYSKSSNCKLMSLWKSIRDQSPAPKFLLDALVARNQNWCRIRKRWTFRGKGRLCGYLGISIVCAPRLVFCDFA